ncbi:MAG: mechanosensitive ion channel domain-containing protein [archaeon]
MKDSENKTTFKVNNKKPVLLIFLFLVFTAIEFAYMHWDLLIPKNVIDMIHLVFLIIITLLVVNVFIRLTEKQVFKYLESEIELEQMIFLSKIYSVVLYSIGIAFILAKAGVSIDNITLFIGLIATGIAFAVRDLLIAIIAWFVILTKKPFRIGYFIKVGEYYGKVERIGTFFVTIKDPFFKIIIKLPNKFIFENTIINYGANKNIKTLSFPLKAIPTEVKEIKKDVEKLCPENEISFEIINETPTLLIRYAYSPYDEEIHFKVMKLIYEKYKQIVLKK